MNLGYLTIALSMCVSTMALAGTTIPDCTASGAPLGVNNDQVAQWKTTTPNQFLGRAHVTGVVANIYPNQNKHNHFEIQLDTAAGDTLEVVFSQCDGKLPALHAGMRVEACGDFITSTAASGSYSASPDGAIIHWVHENVPKDLCGNKYKDDGHDSGYLAIDGQVYGWY